MASGMVAIGLTLTISVYASLFIQQCESCDHSGGRAFLVLVPVAGPLVTAATRSVVRDENLDAVSPRPRGS